MPDTIEVGQMAFLADGAPGVGAIRSVSADKIVVYVENAGEFAIPRSAIKDVHSQKVILDATRLERAFLEAVGHAHDREDPAVG